MRNLPRQKPASSAPPLAVAPSLRGVIDGLVQGALVELLGAYGVAVAPQRRAAHDRALTVPEVCAGAPFSSGNAKPGRVTLAMPPGVVELMKGATGLKADWARELANQLAGRIKNRLLQFGVRLEVGAPSMVDSNVLTRQIASTPEMRVYGGRTLRGLVLVTIEGLPPESELHWVGRTNGASEGDTILF